MKSWKKILMAGFILAVLVSTLPLCICRTEGGVENHTSQINDIQEINDIKDLILQESPRDLRDEREEDTSGESLVDERAIIAYAYAYMEETKTGGKSRKAEAIVRATASSNLKSIVEAHGNAEAKNGAAFVGMDCLADALSSATFDGFIRAHGDLGRGSINVRLFASPISSGAIAEMEGCALNGIVEGEASGEAKSLKLAVGHLSLYGKGDEVRAYGLMTAFSIGPITMVYTFAYVVALNGDTGTDLSHPLKLDTDKSKISRIMGWLGLEIKDIKVEAGDDLDLNLGFDPELTLSLLLPFPSSPGSS